MHRFWSTNECTIVHRFLIKRLSDFYLIKFLLGFVIFMPPFCIADQQFDQNFMQDSATSGAIGPPSLNIYDHLPPVDDELASGIS